MSDYVATRLSVLCADINHISPPNPLFDLSYALTIHQIHSQMSEPKFNRPAEYDPELSAQEKDSKRIDSDLGIGTWSFWLDKRI